MAEAHSDHHVQFATGTHLEPEPIHIVKAEDPSCPLEAHAGILQNHHTYSVAFPIPHSLGPVVSARPTGDSTCFTLMEPPDTVEGVDEGYKYVTVVKLQAKIDTEGRIAEVIELYLEDGVESPSSMKVLLTAKVIKCDEGTPLLKDGVHIISHHHLHSKECAIKEWPGNWKEENHVQFASDTHLDPEPICLSREDSTLPPEIYVGLLRNHHTYSVDVPIPHSLGPVVSTRIPETNLCFKVMEVIETVESETGIEDGDKYVTTVKLQVKTLVEGNIVETMELFVEEGEQPFNTMEVLLTAKVIKCNEGNPLLRNGVHIIIAHQHSETCAFKEWPGSYKEENRVRFASGTLLDPEPIRLTMEEPNLVPEAHIGILRHHHTYSVALPVSHSLGPVVTARPTKDSACFTVTELPSTVESKDDSGCKYVSTVKLQVKVVTEGNIAETLELHVDGGGESTSVLLTAKVIKCNQGIPLLKDGVHVIGHHECAVKEWPGSWKEEEHHVRFASGTHLDPEPILLSREGTPEVHMGILRSHHTYSVDVPIPHSLGPVVSTRIPKTNLCFTVMEAPKTVEPETGMEDGDKYITTVKLQVETLAEGNIVETMRLFVNGGELEPSKTMEVQLTAKVIKCNEGNPLLRDGVHIIAHQHSEACAFKEWPGSYKEDNRVKFASGTHLDPQPIHLVGAEDPNLPPEAHVGILQNHHTYSVDIPTRHSLGSDVSARHAETNIYFTVTELPVTVEAEPKDHYISTIKLQVKTDKEGSIAEKIQLFAGNSKEERMEVLLTAKVIKNNQGTPLLKDGVRMLSRQHSDESDFTEWPGFDKAGEEMEN